MGEFRLLTSDVCNIYSGLPNRRDYGEEYSPTMNAIRIAKANEKLKKTVLDREKYLSTLAEVRIPRAPAFRNYSRHRVDPVVKRLLQPTIAREGFNAEKHKGRLKNKNFAEEEDRSSYPGYQKIKKGELAYVIARLLRPTHMSMLKQRLPPPPLNVKSAVRRELAESFEKSYTMPPID
ncbi:hypothetical protein FSP39_016891 [Pinctada imbricata]|uniref:Uncharacterized protein n=1 Tax=Pinctada imbricata TaxID=66713 RepID=A0AA89BRD9_PINIB|nr:hypothetical protein FSP39_016891 [Pinctada imbricata]